MKKMYNQILFFVLKNPIPVIVIEVPALPTVGEIDVTDPIVHGVKRN